MCGLLVDVKKSKNISAELLDNSEPLIHDTYGCGSQGLINLMLTGQGNIEQNIIFFKFNSSLLY